METVTIPKALAEAILSVLAELPVGRVGQLFFEFLNAVRGSDQG